MKKIVFIAAILMNTFAFSQIDRSIRPTAAKASAINIKDSEVFTMENGLTVILSENHKIAKVSVQFVSGSDPYFEKDKAGTAEITGELIMSGTKSRTKDELDAQVDYIGASMYAGKESVTISCLTKHIDKGFELFADVLMNASIPQSEFDRIIKMSESSLMSVKSNPEAIAENVSSKLVYKNHPYGEVLSETTIKNITREDVLARYKQAFNPTGGYLVIVGDMNRQQAEQYAKKYLGAWEAGTKVTNTFNSNPAPKGTNVVFVNKPGAVQSYITVAFPLDIKLGDSRHLGLSVANAVLGGGGFGTRLFQNLREDKGYTYGAYSSIGVTSQGSSFDASGSFRNEVTDSAIVELLKEIQAMGDGYVTADELLMTKSSMAGKFALSLEQPATVARFALNTIRYNLPKDYYKNYLRNLEAVDKDAVLQNSQSFFSAKNCYIIVVGNEEVLDKIKKFDSDGKIDVLDAFGDEIKERKATTVTSSKVYEDYLLAMTKTNSLKAANKKVAKLKSVKVVSDYKSAMIPMPMTNNEYFVSPNKSYNEISADKMVLQKEVFDGKAGFYEIMGVGMVDFTPEENAEKLATAGFYNENALLSGKIKSEVLGIETLNDSEVYVVKITGAKTQSFNYYDVKSHLKVKSLMLAEQEGETVSTEVFYSDYREHEGYLFPYKTMMSMPGITFDGQVKLVEVNKAIDSNLFKK